MLPLSFKEYITAFDDKNYQKLFLAYMKNGGMPGNISILKFIFDSIGSPISAKKISDTLTSKGMSTSNHTVQNYITSFIESFLIYKAERFDIKGKNLLARDYKYYIVDTGLRSYLLGKKADSDKGHILENIVYLELLRRGYKVYVGKVDNILIHLCFLQQNQLLLFFLFKNL